MVAVGWRLRGLCWGCERGVAWLWVESGVVWLGWVSSVIVGGPLVGLVGWCIVGWGVGLVRMWHGEVTLSVQDLMCDGCRGVAVEGGFVGVVGGVWHFCGLWVWLCGWFGLPWWALVG